MMTPGYALCIRGSPDRGSVTPRMLPCRSAISIRFMTYADHTPFEMPQELAARASDQIEVTLLWWEHENRVAVSVIDRKAS